MSGEFQDKTLLLVDDDKDILASMQAALGDLGAKVLSATDGNTALEQAQENEPDVVILDMMLPKRSGFLVMEKLKSGKKRGDRPQIIMITGNRGVRHKDYAESLGVSAYLNKPFRMEKLVETVRGLLEG